MNFQGRNRAITKKALLKEAADSNICFFISHSHKDKVAAKGIGDYIVHSGLDIYLDVYDEALQDASKNNDPKLITKQIEDGIMNCSHVLCLVSNGNNESWWVPYELGFGKKSNKNLVTLKLIGNVYLPDYLQISRILKGTSSLNNYLRSLLSGKVNESYMFKSSMNDGYLLNHHEMPHPLDKYLDWNL